MTMNMGYEFLKRTCRFSFKSAVVRNSLVKTYYFATVDGGRADLPYPRAADDLTITHEEYAVARAVNNGPSRVDFDRHILRFRVE
jgi:hypothetical protein